MQLFYVPDITGSRCVLERNESRHCIRVMRLSRGDRILITDGRGSLYEGIIDDPDPSACVISIAGLIPESGKFMPVEFNVKAFTYFFSGISRK